MATKAELADQIAELTGNKPNPDDHTHEQLTEMLVSASTALDKDTVPEPDEGRETSFRRHKVNRGSRRRIERALKRFDTDVSDFIKEMDLQCFIADEDGNRVAPWPMVDGLKEMKSRVREEINAVLTVGNEPQDKAG